MEWTEGKPDKGGNYWLRFTPTPLLLKLMRARNLARYAHICDCHGELLGLCEADRRRIDSGFYVVTGYIELPDA